MKSIGGIGLTTLFQTDPPTPPGARTDGEVNWTFELGDWNTSSPTIVDRTAFIGSGTGNLYAIDTTTGEREWAFETGDLVVSSPTVLDGTVIFGSNDNNIYAVDASSGEEHWSFETGSEVMSSPVIVDSTVFVGSGDGNLYAIDAMSGDEQWRFETNSAVATSPIVANGSVYIGNKDNGFYKLDIDNNREVWQFTTEGSVEGITVAENAIFVTSSITEWDEETDELEHDEGHIYRVDIDSGEEIWESNVESAISSTPTVSNGILVTGVGTDTAAFDTETGEQLWESPSGSTVRSPTIVGDRVYTAGNHVRGFNIATGELEWKHFIGRTTPSSPIVTGGVIFIAFGDLYSIEIGADGSSDGSRAETGTLGHHDSWQYAGQSIGGEADTGGRGTVFRQISESADNPAVLAGGGVAAAGIGYFAYQKLQNDDESASVEELSNSSCINEPQSTSSESTPTVQLTVSEYDDLDLGTNVTHHNNIQIDRATSQNEAVWVVTPDSDGDTIDTDQFDDFLDRVNPWANMANHPNILSVYGHGTEPLPWAATEPADYPALLDQTVSSSTEETLQLLTEVCEAVHHIQRYGISYQNLSSDSVLIDDTTAVLRGILDHVTAGNDGYELPDQKEAPASEQADVYRLGALACAALNNEQSGASNPIRPSSHDTSISDELDEVLSTALAEEPEDRYETVLHLRDELRKCIELA